MMSMQSLQSMSESEKELEFSKRIHKETLISLVESRPILWDKALDAYKDKAAKATAWREVCMVLMDNYGEMTPRDRHDFGKVVIKKWSQTRDAWIRTLKEEKKCNKSGTPSKPYRYHDRMIFLKRVVLPGEPNCPSPTTQPSKEIEIEINVPSTPKTGEEDEMAKRMNMDKEPPIPIKKRKPNDVDEKMQLFIEYHNARRLAATSHNEDRNMTFFKSLLPSLALLDDDQTLEFQSGVLGLLQNIKRRPAYYDMSQWRQSQVFFPQTSEDCQSPSATSMSAQSQSSEVPDLPIQVKIERE